MNSTQNATNPPRHSVDAEIARLEWDSDHFGFSVARLWPSDASESGLAVVLARARRQGVVMAVWTTGPEMRVSRELLSDFHGDLVDEKSTFAGELATLSTAKCSETSSLRDGSLCENHATASNAIIQPYSEATASEKLLALSIAAGIYSRFNCDPRFPREKFEELYRIWMERSVRRELADMVFVARDATSPTSGLMGMVTVSVADGVGSIGLIAVGQKARGRGVGTRLIDAAHDWMREHGAVDARVVTQGANLPACKLYERAGYRLASVEHYYHFWPLGQQTAGFEGNRDR